MIKSVETGQWSHGGTNSPPCSPPSRSLVRPFARSFVYSPLARSLVRSPRCSPPSRSRCNGLLILRPLAAFGFNGVRRWCAVITCEAASVRPYAKNRHWRHNHALLSRHRNPTPSLSVTHARRATWHPFPSSSDAFKITHEQLPGGSAIEATCFLLIAVSKGASPLGAPGFVYAVTDSSNLQCHRGPYQSSSSTPAARPRPFHTPSGHRHDLPYSIRPSVPKNSERDCPFCSKADVCGKARGRTIVINGSKITEN